MMKTFPQYRTTAAGNNAFSLFRNESDCAKNLSYHYSYVKLWSSSSCRKILDTKTGLFWRHIFFGQNRDNCLIWHEVNKNLSYFKTRETFHRKQAWTTLTFILSPKSDKRFYQALCEAWACAEVAGHGQQKSAIFLNEQKSCTTKIHTWTLNRR